MDTQPSPHYRECVSALDNVVRHCIAVSRACAGIPARTGKHYYASLLFTSLTTRSVTLAILLPHSPWSKKQLEHWDYSSTAGIVRSILELRLAFFYLCSEKCAPVEWQCRWNLLNLHDCTSRIHLFENFPDAQDHLDGFSEQAKELRARLTSNPFFNALPSTQRKRLLKGGNAYLCSLEEIAARAGVDLNTFRWLYRLFSSHVHGLPLSYYRMGEQNRGRGVRSDSEEKYTSLCISFAVSLLVAARDEMKTLFPEGRDA